MNQNLNTLNKVVPDFKTHARKNNIILDKVIIVIVTVEV